MVRLMRPALIGAALMMAGAAEADPLGGGCGPDQPPTCVPIKPEIPQALTIDGIFGYHDSATNTDRSGAIDTDADGSLYWIDTTEGGDPTPVHHAISGTTILGDANSNISFTIVPPNSPGGPKATVAAYQTVPYSAYAEVGINYLLKIHTTNDDGMAAVQALLQNNPQFATASGNYMMKVTGSGGVQNVAATGFFGPSFQQILFYCPDVPGSGAPGCGSGTYEVPINYVSGDMFDGGDAHDFYSQVSLGTFAYQTYGYTGTADGMIDPDIRFSDSFYQAIASLPQGSVTFSVAGADVPLSPAPEPAAWAMMIMGFGLTGAALRRSRGALSPDLPGTVGR